MWVGGLLGRVGRWQREGGGGGAAGASSCHMLGLCSTADEPPRPSQEYCWVNDNTRVDCAVCSAQPSLHVSTKLEVTMGW